jgi:hypothetical protein
MAWCFRAESARHHAPHPLLRSLIVCASSGAGSGKNAARHKAAPSDSGSRHRSAQDRDAMPATKPSKKVTTIGKRRQIWCSALSFSITYSERSRRGPSLYLRCGDRSFGSVAIRRPTSIMRQDQTICRHPQRMAPCQLPAGAGHRPKARHIPEEKGRSKRAMPMRLRQEIQEMLRSSFDRNKEFWTSKS